MPKSHPYNLSQDAIDVLMKNPFLDKDSVLYIKDAPDDVYMQSPLFRQVWRILEATSADSKGLQLTKTKVFSNDLKVELYNLGKPEIKVDSKVRRNFCEDIAWSISIAKAICIQLKLVRHYRYRMLITPKGRVLFKDKKELFATIMNLLCTSFDWGYRVQRPIFPNVHNGCAPILLSLMEENIPRTVHFYRVILLNKYRPDLVQYGKFDDFRSDEELDTRISIYIFERFLWQMGLIEVSSGKYYIDDGLMRVNRSSLFDQVIGVSNTRQ